MLHVAHVREHVIRPTLKFIELHSDAAENLVLGTMAQESRLTYLKQLGAGPGLGLAQMEPATFFWLWNDYLPRRAALHDRVRELIGTWRHNVDLPSEMVTNLAFAVAMCRIRYLAAPAPLPAADDVDGLARYWKKYYNTDQGAGTVEQFAANYHMIATKG